jgi:2-polyprenyl-6-methoxyphenol hydroxylase-like FAD-dependent oxidoreductase
MGGLTAAIALRRAGWSVTVLERAAALGEVGAGLTLWPNAVRALAVLGLDEAVAARGVPTISRGNLRAPSGRWLRHSRPGDVGVLAMHRADLHEVLREALPAEVLVTGADVVAVKDDATVTYERGGTRREVVADLVVGADGVHSVTRTGLWPGHPGPVFQGRTVWRGVTTPGAVWPVQECLTLGRGVQVGLLPLPGERVYWFLTANADRPDRAYDDEHAEVRRRVAGWHDPVPALVAATEPDKVLHNDIVDLDPLPTYVKNRVVLLGDAAHAMPPDLGQGACQAIEDAVVLAHALGGTSDVTAALASYDEQRRARTQPMAAAARASVKRTSNTSPVAHAVVALAARLVPPKAWRKATARWSDWSPPA